MATVNAPINRFTGGILGKYLAGRVDVPEYPGSAEVMDNFRALAQGPMTRRPAMRYLDTLENAGRPGKLFKFIFNSDQSYVALAHAGKFTFYIDDGLLSAPEVISEDVLIGQPIGLLLSLTQDAVASIKDGVFDGGNVDRALAATITATSTASGSLANLVDGDAASHWRANSTATQNLNFDLGSAYTIYDVWLTADDTLNAHAPKRFQVLGSPSGDFAGEEETLLTVSDAGSWEAEQRRKYRLDAPGNYRYYRIVIYSSETGSGNYALSEVTLKDSPWVDESTINGSVSIADGKMYLDSDGASVAAANQSVSILSANVDLEHVIQFDVDHGPINLKVGTTAGADDVASYSGLQTGYHQIAITPGATKVYVQLWHSDDARRIVDNVSLLQGSAFSVAHPYSDTELDELQYTQIGDVLYLCHSNHETRRLERRSHRSWSLTYNRTDNGPFDTINQTPTTISASDTSGNVTLTASDDLFVSTDPGQLFSLTDSGQTQTVSASSAGETTNGIQVTGRDGARVFNVQVTITGTATVRLQESSGNQNNYVDTSTTFTSDSNVNYNDNRDNEVWFFRLLVESHSSGTVTMKLTYSGGASTGIVRVVTVTNGTTATAEVISDLPSTNAVVSWKRSSWNALSGWPSAVTSGFGRLWFGRGITVWASVSDDFTDFDEGTDADRAFTVTLAQESSEGIQWLQFVDVLVIGTRTREFIGLGNTSSEPVSPTNFQTIARSEEGGAKVRTEVSEGSVVYVHRSRKKLMQFTLSPQAFGQTSYVSIDLSELAPELLDSEVVDIAIQREPQRRVFAVLKSGRLGELLFRREIEVTAWSLGGTEGRYEDCLVVPQSDEDRVYFITQRKIAGSNTRFLERYEREYVYNDWDNYHLDCALTRDITKPASDITLSGTSGSITVVSDETGVFSSSDVGNRFWVGGGTGLITEYVSNRTIRFEATSPLVDLEDDDPIPVIPAGRWGHASEITEVSGLDHLEGHSVRVYGNLKDHGDFTVSGGAITLTNPASIIHAGLSFKSRWRSLKLAYGAQKGTAMGMKKSVKRLIAILHKAGTQMFHGPTFSRLTRIKTRDASAWDEPVPLFTGEKNDLNFDTRKDTDPRICVVADGPEPATVVALVPTIETHDV